MKRFLILLSILFCSITMADTINLHWLNYDGTTYQDSTCEINSDLILPSTPPTRYGYTFTGWKIASYIPIEYLESTGTQYIDTGVNPTGGCKIDAVIAPKLNNGVFNMQIGSIGDFNENPDLTRNLVAMNGNKVDPEKLEIYGSYCATVNGEIPVHIYFNSIGTTFYAEINDTVCVNRTAGVLSNQTNTIKIGFSDYSKTVRQQRNYYAKIWDSTDTLVRDFIPVLDGAGTPCMLDRVTGQFFYNQGTGQFIAGPVLE